MANFLNPYSPCHVIKICFSPVPHQEHTYYIQENMLIRVGDSEAAFKNTSAQVALNCQGLFIFNIEATQNKYNFQHLNHIIYHL